jgi:hypothetical protein
MTLEQLELAERLIVEFASLTLILVYPLLRRR